MSRLIRYNSYNLFQRYLVSLAVNCYEGFSGVSEVSQAICSIVPTEHFSIASNSPIGQSFPHNVT
jgi:hypothetical protein